MVEIWEKTDHCNRRADFRGAGAEAMVPRLGSATTSDQDSRRITELPQSLGAKPTWSSPKWHLSSVIHDCLNAAKGAQEYGHEYLDLIY